MKPETPETPRLSTDERRFVETLSSAYQPESLTEVQRAAFDARLREKLDARRRVPFSLPGALPAAFPAAFPAALAASVVAALIWVGVEPSEPAPLREVVASNSAGELPNVWEEQLFFASLGEVSFDDSDDESTLPPEYAAIESAFF